MERVLRDPSLTPFEGFRVLKLKLPLPGEDRVDPNRNLRQLRDHGYRVTYGLHAFDMSSDTKRAGSASARASDLMEAFADGDVDVVLAAGAGSGSDELLEFLAAECPPADVRRLSETDTAFDARLWRKIRSHAATNLSFHFLGNACQYGAKLP